MLIAIISCGQNNSQETLPNTKIDVQKEVDENGNIIRYDSTYSYSNFSADSSFLNLNIDSIFQNFNSRYDFDHSPFFKSQDSLFKHFLIQVFSNQTTIEIVLILRRNLRDYLINIDFFLIITYLFQTKKQIKKELKFK